MADRYFISEYADWRPAHGGIGNHDIEVILEREGFKPIRFPAADSLGPLAKIRRSLHLLRLVVSLPSDAVIAFQHPLDARMSALAVNALNRGKRKLLCIVSDIDGLKDEDGGLLKKERRQFLKYRHFIVHNPVMEDWFRKQGIRGKFASLDLFDYLAIGVAAPRELSLDIAYAGNLAFRPFVTRLSALSTSCPNLRFHIYGDRGMTAAQRGNHVSFHGSVEAHEMAARIRGSFGLIWEGDSLERLSGGFSAYLRYISPHKLSMYIAAGMPIICHPDMAIAGFVRDHGIGLLVTDLHLLESQLRSIDGELYAKMRDNCLALRPGIVGGWHLRDAVATLLA